MLAAVKETAADSCDGEVNFLPWDDFVPQNVCGADQRKLQNAGDSAKVRREQPVCIHRAEHVQAPWATWALVRLQCGDPQDPAAYADGFIAHEVLLCLKPPLSFKLTCCVLLPSPGMLGGEALGGLDTQLEQEDPGWGLGDLLGCYPAPLWYRAQGKRRAFRTGEQWRAKLGPVCSLQLELSSLPQGGWWWRLLQGAHQGKSLCYSPGLMMSPMVFSEVLVACSCPSFPMACILPWLLDSALAK